MRSPANTIATNCRGKRSIMSRLPFALLMLISGRENFLVKPVTLIQSTADAIEDTAHATIVLEDPGHLYFFDTPWKARRGEPPR